jgi:catechol 2,3-dioxygenase-like lactoylglutathione lyase family enzyme
VRQSIIHVALVVRDYDEAIAFFRDKLLFTVVEDSYQPTQNKRWVVVAPPGGKGTSLLLARATTDEQMAAIGNQTGGRVFLFLSTDDFSRDYNRMRSAGIEFVREPKVESYGTVAVFRDVSGNLWDLLQLARSPTPQSRPRETEATMGSMNSTTTEIAQTIIGLERAALERWGKGDPSGFLEISGEDVVYFDPFQERRLNGIAELSALYESIRGRVQIAHFELIDPVVQAVDNMAVLTFNYVAHDTNEGTSRWNCTEVFRLDAGTWRIVQTHWSFTQPELRT